MSTRQMDAEIKKYYILSRFPEIKLKIPQYKGKVSQQKISESHSTFIMADIAYRADESDAALEYLQTINSGEENASRGIALKAFLLNEKDNTKKTNDLAQEAFQLEKNDAITLTYLARLNWNQYQAKKQDDMPLNKALEFSKAATQADPQSQEAFTLQARALAEKNLNPEALTSFMAAYQINPTSVSLNSEIGEFLLTLKEPKLAKRFFERVYLRAHSKSQRDYAKNKMNEIDNTNS